MKVNILSLFEVPENDRRPLKESETEILLGLLVAPEESLSVGELIAAYQQYGDVLPDALSIFAYRLQAAPDLTYDPSLVIMLAALSPHPGAAVQYAHALVRETRKQGRTITVSDFCSRLCPFGVATDEAMEAAWLSQKGFTYGLKRDNLLDTAAPWGADWTGEVPE